MWIRCVRPLPLPMIPQPQLCLRLLTTPWWNSSRWERALKLRGRTCCLLYETYQGHVTGSIPVVETHAQKGILLISRIRKKLCSVWFCLQRVEDGSFIKQTTPSEALSSSQSRIISTCSYSGSNIKGIQQSQNGIDFSGRRGHISWILVV